MMKKEQLGEHFFDDDAVNPSIIIFSYEPAKDMGFFVPGQKMPENLRGKKERSGEGDREDCRDGGRRLERRRPRM